jgi:hypothetical protein
MRIAAKAIAVALACLLVFLAALMAIRITFTVLMGGVSDQAILEIFVPQVGLFLNCWLAGYFAQRVAKTNTYAPAIAVATFYFCVFVAIYIEISIYPHPHPIEAVIAVLVCSITPFLGARFANRGKMPNPSSHPTAFGGG